MRISDADIRAVIADLTAQAGQASGAAVRAELQRRHGARGGVTRVYRVLDQSRRGARHEESRALAERVCELEQQLAGMTERAERAEHRELVHQDRAAVEIHRLREKVRELEMAPRVQGVRHEEFMRVYREVVALRKRAAELEDERNAIRRSDPVGP
jgi:hypothetical protein